MKILSSPSELTALAQQWRQDQRTIAFVPTMGNLHSGHLSLVQLAQQRADITVVSIFVNPLQFGAHEDYHHYPRTLEEDCQKLSTLAIDILFTPTVSDIYPQHLDCSTKIQVPQFDNILCGASRPGHFTGVATVVNKLFNLVQPNWAIFGEKDYQQLLIIRQMVKDLFIPIQIISAPIYREADGLAMSSRNRYLTPEQRAIAPALFKILNCAQQQAQTTYRQTGHPASYQTLENTLLEELTLAGFQPDYLTFRAQNTLASPQPTDQHLIILAAAWLGNTRLIDNLAFTLT